MKLAQWKPCFIRGRKWNFTCILYIFLPDLDRSWHGKCSQKFTECWEFHENRSSYSCTLLGGRKYISNLRSTTYFRFWWNST